MDDLTCQSAWNLLQRLSSGDLRVVDVVEAHLARIAARDVSIGAWAYTAAAQAISVAEALDRQGPSSPLFGLPLGIKDIIDTLEMPTAYGSPIYEGFVPAIDSAAVAQLRAAGAVILGKTVTAEFAHRHPGRTVNPHDPARTPGGSSSGSAAAVADRMVPLAVGTQTTASTIRPASYCGVIGYRPTYGLMSMAGVKPCAQSLDTLGLFARDITDCALIRDVLLERPFTAPTNDLSRAPRIAFCRAPFWHLVADAAGRTIENTVALLARAGATVTERRLPSALDDITRHHRTVSTYEHAHNLAAERINAFEQLSPILREGKLKEGLSIPVEHYADAMTALERARTAFTAWLEEDVIVAPSAGDVAPIGRESTGPSEFSAIWTALHVPAISLPLPGGVEGLPLGLQLIGRRGRDLALFEAAAWIERTLN
jgi:Asp-tRNA(Asn)/Glu-tRNA(Gln) amidotransferase A subunit family amidase